MRAEDFQRRTSLLKLPKTTAEKQKLMITNVLLLMEITDLRKEIMKLFFPTVRIQLL